MYTIEGLRDFVRWNYVCGELFQTYHDTPQPINSKVLGSRSFNGWNKGSFILALYGLFVFPKEQIVRIEKNDPIMRGLIRPTEDILDFDISEYFEIIKSPAIFRREDQYRLLRNSIAHSGISITQENSISYLYFQNYTLGPNSFCNFEVRILPSNLATFIGRVGKSYYNYLHSPNI